MNATPRLRGTRPFRALLNFQWRFLPAAAFGDHAPGTISLLWFRSATIRSGPRILDASIVLGLVVRTLNACRELVWLEW